MDTRKLWYYKIEFHVKTYIFIYNFRVYKVELEWSRKDIKLDGKYLSHLRFADDVVLINQVVGKLQDIAIREHTWTTQKLWLKFKKFKTLTLTINSVNKPRITQRAIERMIWVRILEIKEGSY